MNRRGFFSRVLAVLAVGPLARLFSAPKKIVVSSMDVTRATNAFWMNQHAIRPTPEALVKALRETWDRCHVE